MRKSLLVGVLAAVVIAGAPLSVNAATTVNINKTGPRSVNEVLIGGRSRGSLRVKVRNNTNTNVVVVTDQISETGNAKVNGNTDAGSAETGAAENTNATLGDIVVTNENDGSACCGQGGDVAVEITETGKKSKNKVKIYEGGNGVSIKNNTNLGVVNDTIQDAVSGNASVKHNTDGGDAVTGDATNANETDLVVDVLNDNAGSASCGCSGSDVDVVIDTTGPKSYNSVVIGGGSGGGTKIANNTNIDVENLTQQAALSGNAKVSGNTTGGSATTGNASNTNTTGLSFSVQNIN